MKKSKNLLHLPLLACLLVTATALTSQADSLLYDGFDYAAGESVIGKNGGSGNWAPSDGAWRTTGTPSSTLLVGGSLGYTDTNGASLATSGNHLSVTTAVTGGVYRNVSGISVTQEQGGTATYWLSFVGNTSGIPVPGGTGVPYAALTLNTNGDAFMVGAFGSGSQWRTRVGSGNYSSATGVPSSTAQAFVVVRIDVNLNGDDSIHLWLNPELGSEPTLSSAISSTTGSYWSGESFLLSNIRVGTSGTGSLGITLDEIRLGTTYSAVSPIPEASASALMSGGLVFCVVFFVLRRRAKRVA